MRDTVGKLDGRVTLGVVTAGVVLSAGLAGWGGWKIAGSSADAAPAAATSSTVQAGSTGGPATAAPTTSAGPTAAPTTQATAPPSVGRSRAASAPASPARRTGATEMQPAAPPSTAGADIVFVSPWRDHYSGTWSYQVGLLGFPADTVIEISGDDPHGNVQVAPLVMTTTEGSWDPFATRLVMTFAYGGTCAEAEAATVTARGPGFSVTETAPRPLECDGGATPDGPWTRPIVPTPTPAPPPPLPHGG